MKASTKDTIREIRKSGMRFFYICSIIALGVAFFCGIKATSPSMIKTALDYFSQTNLSDFRLVSTYGIRDEDLQKLSEIDGVEDVSGGYSTDQIFEVKDDEDVIKVMSVPQLDGQNTPLLKEGRFPEQTNECVLEYENNNMPDTKIGDELSISRETNPDDIPLHATTFKIVGLVATPQYISLEHGNTNIGDGSVDGYIMVTPEAFDSPRYTEAYIYTDISSQGTDPYSDEYSKAQDAMISKLETAGEEILDDNIYDIRMDALKEIGKAQKEYDDNKATFDKEIADAQKELDDGQQQLDDGYRQYYEGLDTFNREMANAESQLASAEQQLNDGYASYYNGEAEMESQLASGRSKLESGRTELENGYRSYNDGLNQFNEKIAQAEEQLKNAQEQLNSGIVDYQKGVEEFNTQIAQAEEQLKTAEDEYNNGLTQFNQQEAEFNTQIEEAQKQLDQGWSQYQEGKTEFDKNKADFEKQISDAQAELDQSKAQLEQQQAELEAGKKEYEEQYQAYQAAISQYPDPSLIPEELKQMGQQLEQMKLQLEEGEQQLAVGQAQLEAGQNELNAQKEAGEAQLKEAEEELNQALTELQTQQNQLNSEKEKGEAALNEARAQLTEAKTQLDNGRNELETQKQVGAQQLEQAKATLEAASEQLKTGVKQFNDQKESGANQLVLSLKTLEDAEIELVNGENTLIVQEAQARAQLDQGYQELVQGENELNSGRIELNNQRIIGQNQLADSMNTLIDSQNKLITGREEFETQRADGQKKLDDAQKQIDDARNNVNNLDRGEWYVYSRDDNPGYTGYQEDSERIDNIGNVFPLFFFLVAALVAFTTMTRMVEEERTQIGTLYALGFSRWQILKKFIIYSGSAAIIGATIGWILGVLLLPQMIFTAYNILYNMPDMTLDIPWNIVIISYIVSILCTVGAASIIALMELRNVPAELMRPKAPKPGKRILLERIPFIWNRLNFISKVSVRNIFRYKARFLMTVIGIAGCTALILAGFGLHDAIFTIIPNQFGIVFKYDESLVLTEAKTDLDKEVSDLLKDERVSEAMEADQQTVDVDTPSGTTVSTTLVIPGDIENFPTFIALHERTNRDNPIPLTSDGIVVSEKLATNYEASPGSTVKININNKWVDAKVSAQTENYLRNFIYMSPDYYKKITGEEPKYSTIFINFSDKAQTAEEQETFTEDMIKLDTYASAITTSSIVDSSEKMLNSLNIIVIVMIVSAGMLAFIVLNNLTNINISERVREIATLKVLGFRQNETNNYIFRENIILSIIGIVLGLFLGVLLLRYIIYTVELDIIMFGREIKLASYFYAVLLTLGFTIIVNFTMIPIINRVNMVESLKDLD